MEPLQRSIPLEMSVLANSLHGNVSTGLTLSLWRSRLRSQDYAENPPCYFPGAHPTGTAHNLATTAGEQGETINQSYRALITERRVALDGNGAWLGQLYSKPIVSLPKLTPTVLTTWMTEPCSPRPESGSIYAEEITEVDREERLTMTSQETVGSAQTQREAQKILGSSKIPYVRLDRLKIHLTQGHPVSLTTGQPLEGTTETIEQTLEAKEAQSRPRPSAQHPGHLTSPAGTTLHPQDRLPLPTPSTVLQPEPELRVQFKSESPVRCESETFIEYETKLQSEFNLDMEEDPVAEPELTQFDWALEPGSDHFESETCPVSDQEMELACESGPVSDSVCGIEPVSEVGGEGSAGLWVPLDGSVDGEEPEEEGREMENEDFCAVCLNGGDLLCCDRCPKVYHLSCHMPPLLSFPVGDWVCTLCRSVQEPEMEYDCENNHLSSDNRGTNVIYGLSSYDQRRCEKMTLLIFCNVLSGPFHEPVSPLARHYYQIIKRPMDLSVIRRKLNKRNPQHYRTPGEFVSDVLLMFRNCTKFNYPDSEVAQAGRSLEAYFSSTLREVFPDQAFPALQHYRAWSDRRRRCHSERRRKRGLLLNRKRQLL